MSEAWVLTHFLCGLFQGPAPGKVGQKREMIQGVVLRRLSVGASSGFLFISLCAILGTVHGTQRMIFKC